MFLESQDRGLAEKRREMGRVPTGGQIDNMIHRISYRDSEKAHENTRWLVSPIMFGAEVLGSKL